VGTCKVRLSHLLMLGFLASGAAHAEIVPRAIHGSVGMMTLSTYSDRYQPTTANLSVSSMGMDVALTNRWSGSFNALMSTDETIAAFGFGGRFHFVRRRVVTNGGRNGYVQHTITSVPRWHFDVGAAVARYRVNQSLSTNDPFTITALRRVPVQADLYGLALAPSASLAFDERWALEGRYTYGYATATGFNIVAHAMTLGVSFSF
jgi:hypothetical protein